jgi:hypothetical protein
MRLDRPSPATCGFPLGRGSNGAASSKICSVRSAGSNWSFRFGGFLGIGEDDYPLPWRLLTYNPELDGYQVAIGADQLGRAPKYRDEREWEWSRDHAGAIDDYWGPTILAA